jgi:FtsP/CotA-like multicopper oxidase with cupredoxin domain
MLTSKTLAILAISITAFSGFVVLQYFHLPNAAFDVSLAQSCDRPLGYVLVILDDNGFNDSIHTGQPTIESQRGDTVNILVCNLDPVQSHGFAIDHYFATGVTLRPGEAYKVSFVARDPGSFTIYCNVFCTVHTFMKGRLVVN